MTTRHRLVAFKPRGILHSDTFHDSEASAWSHAHQILSQNPRFKVDYRLETYQGDRLVESRFQGQFTWEDNRKQAKISPYFQD